MGGKDMKQFNLEEYLKNPSMKVVTMNGDSVRIICTDRLGEFPIIGLVRTDNIEKVMSYTNSGHACREKPLECDLIFAPERKEGWVNVYRQDNRQLCGNIYNTESEANLHSRSSGYITTIKIEWEE